MNDFKFLYEYYRKQDELRVMPIEFDVFCSQVSFAWDWEENFRVIMTHPLASGYGCVVDLCSEDVYNLYERKDSMIISTNTVVQPLIYEALTFLYDSYKEYRAKYPRIVRKLRRVIFDD